MDVKSELYRNSIVFPIERKKVSIGLFFKENRKLKHLRKEHFKEYTSDGKILERIDESVWISTKTENADMVFSFMLDEHLYLAKWWYENQVYEVLRGLIRIVRRIFTGGWQYWVENKEGKTRQYLVFRKFNLFFRYLDTGSSIEITISYEGQSKVLLKNVQNLVSKHQLDTTLLKSVIFEKECQPYRRIEENIRLQQDLVYPIIGRKIAHLLEIEISKTKNLYPLTTAVNEIQFFLKNYLNDDAMKALVVLPTEWQLMKADSVFKIQDTSKVMSFGQNNTSADINHGFKLHGPYQLPKKRHYKVFFIYTSTGLEAKKQIENHLNKHVGYSNIQKYSHLPLVYDASLDYEIKEMKNIKEDLQDYIRQLTLQSDVQYFAFYLSPYSKYNNQNNEEQYYHDVKEILLKRSIASQVLDQSKIRGNINFWIANISMAMIAKMGGIPWKLARETAKELIVGFGAFRTGDRKLPYVGSSFCFDNEGRFQEFDCWQEVEEWAFKGQLIKAIRNYQSQNKEIKQLVIHYYKDLNKKEFREVEYLLDRFRSDIPIIVVRINNTFNQKELVMDLKHPKYLPVNGSYYHLQSHDYLLYINDRLEERQSFLKTAKYPLKISLQSNIPGLFDKQPDIIGRLMQQLYDFSLLHWRSINQPRLPVTIAYPQYLARIFPHFDAENLQGIGKTSLWFL